MRTRLKLTIIAALFSFGAGVGTLLAPQDVVAQGTVHGCWYQPPNPPACDACFGSCGSGQKCCTINEM